MMFLHYIPYQPYNQEHNSNSGKRSMSGKRKIDEVLVKLPRNVTSNEKIVRIYTSSHCSPNHNLCFFFVFFHQNITHGKRKKIENEVFSPFHGVQLSRNVSSNEEEVYTNHTFVTILHS